jgi:hypothetical protein
MNTDSITTIGSRISYDHFKRMIRRLLESSSGKVSYEDEDGDLRIDYSVLSVGVMTLGLIMVVELFRHRLDHTAKGRPFFRTVLDGVYTECKLYRNDDVMIGHTEYNIWVANGLLQ